LVAGDSQVKSGKADFAGCHHFISCRYQKTLEVWNFLAGYNLKKRKTAMPKYVSAQTFKQADKVRKKLGKQGELGI
jgi:hypothetical protein